MNDFELSERIVAAERLRDLQAAAEPLIFWSAVGLAIIALLLAVRAFARAEP